MLDNGGGADTIANDGIYSRYFIKNDGKNGDYTLRCQVKEKIIKFCQQIPSIIYEYECISENKKARVILIGSTSACGPKNPVQTPPTGKLVGTNFLMH